MSERPSIVSHAQVISAFGTSFWIRGDSAADYILHPVFLRFAILCVGIHALLDDSDYTARLVGWQMPVLWLAMTLAVIAGYVVIGSWVLHLFRRGMVRRLYSPFLLLPIVVIAEMTRQSVVVLLQAGDWLPLPLILMSVTRDFLVILLMDVLHVQFVAPLHPLARTDAPDDAPKGTGSTPVTRPENGMPPAGELRAPADPIAEPRNTPMETLAEPEAGTQARADIGSVRIADRVFSIGEIQSVRTEDHYLNVVTRTARSMVRAKLSDIVALHDGRYGVQINRSQWVAFAASEAVRDEDNGQVTLQLVNGDSATVSRTRRLMFMQLYNTQRARTA